MTATAIPRSTALTEAGREWGKPLTEADARELTAQIRTSVEALLPLIRTAYQRRADLALGYASWEAYCDGELHALRLAVADRQEAVAGLRAEGMSTRAIGAALGVSHQTVANDLRSTGQDLTVERITGLDGREQPASRPTPTPGPVDAALSPPADPGMTPAPAVESPAPAAPQGPVPTPEPGAGGDLRDHVLAALRPDEDDAWGLDDICSRLPGYGEPGQARPGEVREVLAVLVEAGLAGAGRDSDGPYWWKAVPKSSPASRELAAEQARESQRRTTVANLRSILLYLTSTAIAPAELAEQYAIALAEFTAADLRFAAETMAAIAALKEQ